MRRREGRLGDDPAKDRRRRFGKRHWIVSIG
jgi:hypothetical protein